MMKSRKCVGRAEDTRRKESRVGVEGCGETTYL